VEDRKIELARRLGMPHPGNATDRIHELLRAHAANCRPAKNIMHVLLLLNRYCGPLVNIRSQNALDRLLEIVTMADQILREPVQNTRMPRGRFHVVEGFDETAPHETGPEAVHDRARKPAILAAGNQLRQLLLPLGLAGLCVDVAELW